MGGRASWGLGQESETAFPPGPTMGAAWGPGNLSGLCPGPCPSGSLKAPVRRESARRSLNCQRPLFTSTPCIPVMAGKGSPFVMGTQASSTPFQAFPLHAEPEALASPIPRLVAPGGSLHSPPEDSQPLRCCCKGADTRWASPHLLHLLLAGPLGAIIGPSASFFKVVGGPAIFFCQWQHAGCLPTGPGPGLGRSSGSRSHHLHSHGPHPLSRRFCPHSRGLGTASSFPEPRAGLAQRHG